MEEQTKASLVNLKDGALVEMFDRCMSEVLENISDINTPAKDKRKVVMEVTFHPTDDRAIVGITATCNPKLTGQQAITTMGLLKGNSLFENKPKQIGMFDNNVHQFERGKI